MKQMLTLNINPELEEELVDYLLDKGQSGFTSFNARGHGGLINLSVAEQVSGRRKRVQFEMILEETKVQDVLNGLESEVGKDIAYWVQPILHSGSV